MKKIIKAVLAITLFIFLSNSGYASLLNRDNDDRLLEAAKGQRVIKYKSGSYISVAYGDSYKNIKGRLKAITEDSIFIEPLNTKQPVASVAVSNIKSVTKIHRAGRKGWITILSVLTIMTISGILLSESGSLLALFALGIPAVSLFTYIPFLLISFLSDAFSKKSIKKGWVFSCTP